MNLDTNPQLERLAGDYVLGTMPLRARRRMEALLRRSPAVRAAVDAWSNRLHLLSRIEFDLEPSPALFGRIEQRMEQRTEQRISAARRNSAVPPQAAAPRVPAGSWWRPALGFALGVLVTVALTTLRPTAFETLTDPPAPTEPQRQTLRVLFAPDASVEQLQAALRSVHANIVAGPSEMGVVTVTIAPGQPVPLALATLRAQPGVRFAEAVGRASP